MFFTLAAVACRVSACCNNHMCVIRARAPFGDGWLDARMFHYAQERGRGAAAVAGSMRAQVRRVKLACSQWGACAAPARAHTTQSVVARNICCGPALIAAGGLVSRCVGACLCWRRAWWMRSDCLWPHHISMRAARQPCWVEVTTRGRKSNGGMKGITGAMAVSCPQLVSSQLAPPALHVCWLQAAGCMSAAGLPPRGILCHESAGRPGAGHLRTQSNEMVVNRPPLAAS